MKVYYPGILMIPLLLFAMVAVSALDRFGILQFARVWALWPVTLIATGVEELYLWSISKKERR